jgi:hypothetical protein
MIYGCARGLDQRSEGRRSGGGAAEAHRRAEGRGRRRRAQGATLDELARSYNVGISTIRRTTRAA